MKKFDISLTTFLVLFIVGNSIPFLLQSSLPIAAIITGIIISIIWLLTMPKTCRSGGMITFLILGLQMAIGLQWLILGIVKIVK
jgi:hypothetical protein